MRLLTWNINGIRTLPKYHPWNTLKTGDAILNEIGADIICFQEIKSSRQTIEKNVALPESYDAFFSFPIARGGYSGVSVYTKVSQVIPLKVEEGLSGYLRVGIKPPLTPEEYVSHDLPSAHELNLLEDEVTNTHTDLTELDKEGRALILDFGLFVLINLYCPNETSDARLPYKMNFHLLLEERVRRLVEIDKREVIVTGDINVCAAPIDHCDGELPSNRETFWDHPARKWLHEWLDPCGPMVDVVRKCWPERKGMYTCWNQKINARESNYGTRIDYFLLTKGLLPWLKHGDILPSIKGSDHCPVYIDFYDEIKDEQGKTLSLKDLMNPKKEERETPRLATKYWAEYSGKQKLLSNFFKKKSISRDSSLAAPVTPSGQIRTLPKVVIELDPPKPVGALQEGNTGSHSHSQDTTLFSSDRGNLTKEDSEGQLSESSPSPSNLTASSSSKAGGSLDKSTKHPSKRKKMQADSNYPPQTTKRLKKYEQQTKSKARSKNPLSSQTKLSSFFTGPSPSQEHAGVADEPKNIHSGSLEDIEYIDVDALMDVSSAVDSPRSQSQSSIPTPSPSLSLPTLSGSNTDNGKEKDNSQSWRTLFARVEPPRCMVHGEYAKQFTVNKPGPNKGKTFFVCSRPVGPGYDAGRDVRRREEVDPRYRCNFFKWSHEVKRESRRD